MNNEQKIRYRNPFILPVFGIALFIILTMTVTYGYYSLNTSIATAKGNMTMPRKCVLTTVNSTASTTINQTFLRYDDPISVGGEYGAATTTTSSYIRLNGGTDCSCTYNVVMYTEGSTYMPSAMGQTEFKYFVGGQRSTTAGTNAVNPEWNGITANTYPNDFTNFSSGSTVGTGTIKVVTDGTQVQHTWTYSQRFYNLPDVNQISQQGKSYKYSLRFIINSCTF